MLVNKLLILKYGPLLSWTHCAYIYIYIYMCVCVCVCVYVCMYVCNIISFISSHNENCFRQEPYRKSEHTLYSITIFRRSCRARNNVQKLGSTRQAIDYNIVQRMRFACRITKARTAIQTLIAYLLQHWLH